MQRKKSDFIILCRLFQLAEVSLENFNWTELQLNRASIERSLNWSEICNGWSYSWTVFQFNEVSTLIRQTKRKDFKLTNFKYFFQLVCFNWIWIDFTVRNCKLMCNILNFFTNNESQLQMCRKMCEEAVCGMGASNTLADIYHPSYFKCYSTEFRAFRNTNVFKHL